MTVGEIPMPLPECFLPTVALGQSDQDAYRRMAHEIVTKTLAQEHEFRYEHKGQLSEERWKFLRAKDNLRVYKRLTHRERGRRASSVGSAAGDSAFLPMVIAVGRIEGAMEDVLYGIHHQTTDEMRTTTHFINRHTLDAAVLHTIDSGTDADPYRTLGIKWRISETPGGQLISNRDLCILEGTGTGVDAQGTRYGFHVIKSVDLPWFPELPDPHVIRARVMLCSIYRQVEPHVVELYTKGVFDLSGELLESIAYSTTAETVLGMTAAVDCAEAKRLTQLLLRAQRRRLSSTTNKRPRRTRAMTADGKKGIFTVDRAVHSGSTIKDDDDDDDCCLTDDESAMSRPAREHCSVCARAQGVFARLGSWNHCQICTRLICGKCCVRKRIFTRARHVKIACCKTCIMDAKDMPIDPRRPCPIMPSDVGV